MNWFVNLSLKIKMFIGFGILLVGILLVSIFGINGINTILSAQESLYTVEFPSSMELSNLETDLVSERWALRRMIAATTRDAQISWHLTIKHVETLIKERITKIHGLNKDAPNIVMKLDEFLDLNDEYKAIRDTLIIPLIYSWKREEVSELILGQQTDLAEARLEIIKELSGISSDQDKLLMAKSRETGKETINFFWIASLSALVATILLTFLLVNSIAKPIGELSALSEKITYGDLSVVVTPEKRNDEIGKLRATFAMMIGTLRSVTQEIMSGINSLSSESQRLNEILKQEADAGRGVTENEKSVVDSLDSISEKLKKIVSEYKL